MTVNAHLVKYGPSGVPNGLVEAQKRGKGKTPCLPHSRITRDWPIRTAMRFPKALRAMRKLKPRTAFALPKTAVKKRLATVWPDFLICPLGTEKVALR